MSCKDGVRAAHQHRSSLGPLSGVPVAAARAAVFTVTSAGLASTAHHLASGAPVPWRIVSFAAVLLFAVALPAARTPRPFPAVVTATGAAQAALHLVLARATEHHPAAASHPSHAMTAGGTSGGAHAAWHAGHHGVSMTVAHLVGALLVAWCLRHADTACTALGERLGEVLVGFFVLLAPTGLLLAVPQVVRPVRARAHSPPVVSVVLAHVVVRRGPPVEFVLAV
ncbi:hypothetical protein SALBM135S_07616 [Streptomyces alboniger]